MRCRACSLTERDAEASRCGAQACDHRAAVRAFWGRRTSPDDGYALDVREVRPRREEADPSEGRRKVQESGDGELLLWPSKETEL